MPREFHWRAPVWQAELDAFGELRTSTLLRFLQEAATRASTDAGFDPAYYERTRRMWLVRRSTLTLLAPIRYGDELEARTWIADFRRVRSQRAYDVRAGDRPVARAHTDWVFVDSVLGQPRRIPTEMQALFAPEGAAPLARPPFPADPPPADAHRSLRRVELHELDALRHVNNASYVHYVEQAALDTLSARDWSFERQIDAGGRLRPVEHDLEYLSPALHGETLALTTWPAAVEHDALTVRASIARAADGQPRLRACSRYHWVALTRGAAHELPAALRATLTDTAA